MMRDPAALDAAAQSWEGTPFCANSQIRGAGVSCHQLIGAIYRESGWLPDLPALPAGDPAHARASNQSPMLAWLYGPGAQWFLPVGIESEPIEPGDLLLVRYGHVPHHLALALSQGRVVHVSMRHGVQILPSMPRRFLRYISHRFRILPEIGGRPNV